MKDNERGYHEGYLSAMKDILNLAIHLSKDELIRELKKEIEEYQQ